MEPGRNLQISKITYKPDVIIASDAGVELDFPKFTVEY